MKFTLEVTEEAIENLEYFDKAVQVTVLDAIKQQLVNQPLQETRIRKSLRPNS